jgi:hypothetical protein
MNPLFLLLFERRPSARCMTSFREGREVPPFPAHSRPVALSLAAAAFDLVIEGAAHKVSDRPWSRCGAGADGPGLPTSVDESDRGPDGVQRRLGREPPWAVYRIELRAAAALTRQPRR